KNPAAQLAEAYADEATEAAKALNRKAEELAKNARFGNEVTPTKEQLASATAQQELVKGGVEQVAEDIARAARHERRLEKAAVASALQQAAQDVDQVADNEATKATQQLDTARQAAAAASPQPADQPQKNNQPALDANEALAQSEQAIANQAQALTGVLTPLQQAQAAAAAGEPTGQEASGQSEGSQPGSEAQAAPDASAPPALTPQEMTTGRQLAQALDELDRLQAEPAVAAQEGQSSPAQETTLQQALAQRPGVAQAAQAQQAQIAAARALAQQQAALSNNSAGYQQNGTPAYEGQAGAFVVRPVNRDDNEDWGKLREQAADELTKGRKEAISEEYRKSVETYFRVLAERARRK
ncbi:MAG: hypothetical protein HYV60_14345, partial [Planctomycetia bacterium]|nr:hypothetical protein [Planctomycetia bacterium]